MWYNIDINKLIVLYTPTFLRKPVHIAWVQTLVAPLVDLNEQFKKNREKNLYNLNHNSQVCYLRAVLNDRFDVQLRRIRIDDGNRYKRLYLYTRAEQKPKYLHPREVARPLYLYERSDYSDTGVDFIVFVPYDLRYSKYEMNALIDFYKLASKRYKIVKE